MSLLARRELSRYKQQSLYINQHSSTFDDDVVHVKGFFIVPKNDIICNVCRESVNKYQVKGQFSLKIDLVFLICAC